MVLATNQLINQHLFTHGTMNRSIYRITKLASPHIPTFNKSKVHLIIHRNQSNNYLFT